MSMCVNIRWNYSEYVCKYQVETTVSMGVHIGWNYSEYVCKYRVELQ